MSMQELVVDARNITTKVPTAVWIATLIETYKNVELKRIENGYWIKQSDIQKIASMLCHKNIDNARISQWCNGDHDNNTYNYLRAKDGLRRLSKIGEFQDIKEWPNEIPLNSIVNEEKKLTVLDLVEWFKSVYCKLELERTNRDELYKDAKKCSKQLVSESNHLVASDIVERCHTMIEMAWKVFSNKVGRGLIVINKEASMQLQYAHILQQMIPLIMFQDDEKIELELETGISDGEKIREVDIMLNIIYAEQIHRIAIELKCYKTYASSGGKRGAHDVFMKDVYEDMYLIEKYIKKGEANEGLCLVMTDYKTFPYPNRKDGKCWEYDISEGVIGGKKEYTIDIGGKSVYINLQKEYRFNWKQIGEYYFLKLVGE